MSSRLKKYAQIFYQGVDISVLNLIFLATKFVFHDDAPHFRFYFQLWIIINFAWLILAKVGSLYSRVNRLLLESFSQQTLIIYFSWGISVFLLYVIFPPQYELSRYFISITLILYGIYLLFDRFIYSFPSNYFIKKKYYSKRVLILGFNEVAKKLANYLETENAATQLLGFAEDFKNIKELSNYPIITDINHTVQVSKQLEVNEIYSTLTPEQNKNIYALMQQAELACIRFKLVPDFKLFVRESVHIDYMYDMPILALRNEPLEDIINRATKRLIDIVISGFVVIFLLSWMIPVVGLLIYLESGGPIFFVQTRTGRNNKNFQCYKFRSMKPNNEANLKQATKTDTRITAIGKFLRKTSMDEFPQFLNVLGGSMSIVGPRPHMLKHTEDFSKIEEHYMVRQLLKPGLTGWAQVNGYRGEIINERQVKERVMHDIWYLENWSIWLDLKIIFQTIYILFRGDEMAY
ncbi:MAG TPA: exopolysaccharide biosynthesis polyprenyl glycosylphosphotransferase [Chitinophagaceae bacterium]|jgi:putative colanic acid biosynthesis UDP-glucose lipid carrier transferase